MTRLETIVARWLAYRMARNRKKSVAFFRHLHCAYDDLFYEDNAVTITAAIQDDFDVAVGRKKP